MTRASHQTKLSTFLRCNTHRLLGPTAFEPRLDRLQVSYAVPQFFPAMAEKAKDLADELSPKQLPG